MGAVENGNTEVLGQLLGYENRPTLDFASFGYTPLTQAINDKNYVITEQLLRAGASANFYEGSSRRIPAVMAVVSNNVGIFNLLLIYGADVNLTSDQFSALTWAVKIGSDKFVRLLLRHGAKPCNTSDLWNNFDSSPFALAIAENRCGIVKQFTNNFSERNVQLPLQLFVKLAINKWSEDCAIIFLGEGIYPQHPQHNSPQSSSLFHMAAERGQTKLMNLLIELNPQFLQEEWLIQKKIPPILCEHQSYISWLIEYRQQVPGLQKLCKSSMLSRLGSYYKPKIPELPLPKSLKNYLSLLESAYDDENLKQ